jgi:CIC family chloride channel protein
MLVSAISYTVAKFLEPESIESKKLAERGAALIHDRDKKILSDLSLNSLTEKNFEAVNDQDMLRDLIRVIEKSTRNIFPVTAQDGKLVGVIELNAVRDIMFNTEVYDKVRVIELMRKPPAVIELGESMDDVMKKFDSTDSWNLPVTDQGKYVGFISKSSIFNNYRSQLIEKSVH